MIINKPGILPIANAYDDANLSIAPWGGLLPQALKISEEGVSAKSSLK